MALIQNGISNQKVSSYNNVMESESKAFAALSKLQEARQTAFEEKLSKQRQKLSDKEIKKKEEQEIKLQEKLYKKQLAQLQKYFAQKKKLDSASDKVDIYEQQKRAQEELKARARTVMKMSKKERQALGITDDEYKAAKEVANNFRDNVTALSNLAKKLTSQIETIASYQSRWNTRLQGTGLRYEGFTGLAARLQGTVGMSPLVQLKDVYKNLDTLLDKGITYNVEQRAFLETIKDKIANTFDVANGTLLQLVRVQQADTSAARLGLEANLTRYFNAMYNNTEYLYNQFDSVSSQLYEATSQLSATEGVAFEYQVQKWLGSLYSVGMSSSAIGNIAAALGQLGSGNISGLSDSMLKLLTISVNKANIGGIGKVLAEGLDASQTNKLMESMVGYLQTIASTDSNVVRSQLASVFGLTVSDLTAISNLAVSTATVTKGKLTYSGAIEELMSQANAMYGRLSVGEMMTNMWENIQYGLAAGVSSNPALYALWNVSNALQDLVGGINIPFVEAAGFGVDLNATVSELMRVGALSGGILASTGQLIAGITRGSAGGFSAEAMLRSLGIRPNSMSVISRGAGSDTFTGGETVSQQTYIGNVSGEDLYSSSMSDVQQQKLELQGDIEEDIKIKQVDEHVVEIAGLLKNVITGMASFHVHIDPTI